jgi:hypothetical protein
VRFSPSHKRTPPVSSAAIGGVVNAGAAMTALPERTVKTATSEVEIFIFNLVNVVRPVIDREIQFLLGTVLAITTFQERHGRTERALLFISFTYFYYAII